MKLSKKQLKALEKLEHFISKLPPKRLICNDEGFYRSVISGKPYTGDIVSPEEAYFLKTDKGLDISKEQTTNWERYKSLVIAHRLFGITVSMWRDEWKVMDPIERMGVILELEADGFVNPLKLIKG